MMGPWRFEIAQTMMLVLGELWGRVQWRVHPETGEMVPVIVNVRPKPQDGVIVIDSLNSEGT